MKCIEGVLYDGWVVMLYIEYVVWLMKYCIFYRLGK